MAQRLDTTLNELLELLERHQQTLGTLLKTAQRMSEAIRGKDTEGLQNLTAQYDDQAGILEAIEEKRLALSDRIGRVLGINGHLTLGEIARKVGAPWNEKLRLQRESLKKAMGELARTNRSNTIMLEEALKGVTRSMEILFAAPVKKGMYQKGGRPAQGTPRTPLLNHKA